MRQQYIDRVYLHPGVNNYYKNNFAVDMGDRVKIIITINHLDSTFQSNGDNATTSVTDELYRDLMRYGDYLNHKNLPVIDFEEIDTLHQKLDEEIDVPDDYTTEDMNEAFALITDKLVEGFNSCSTLSHGEVYIEHVDFEGDKLEVIFMEIEKDTILYQHLTNGLIRTVGLIGTTDGSYCYDSIYGIGYQTLS